MECYNFGINQNKSSVTVINLCSVTAVVNAWVFRIWISTWEKREKTCTDANGAPTRLRTAKFPNIINMASRYSHGVQRVLAKLEASINSENYYEAHQMYRTLYFRWDSIGSIASYRRVMFLRILRKFCSFLTSAYRYLGQRKYSELLELLYSGSMLLLQHEQVRVELIFQPSWVSKDFHGFP